MRTKEEHQQFVSQMEEAYNKANEAFNANPNSKTAKVVSDARQAFKAAYYEDYIGKDDAVNEIIEKLIKDFYEQQTIWYA